MAKRTKRRRDRLSKRKFSRRRYSKRRVSRKKNPKRRVSKKRYTKRMKGGMTNEEALELAMAASLREQVRGPEPAGTEETEEEKILADALGMTVEQMRQGHKDARAAKKSTPAREPALEREGKYLGIMRHSLRLDNELDNINPGYNKNQQYYKHGFSYNTPLANDENMNPKIHGVNLENKAMNRILTSIEMGLRDYNFNCIITSPFTRCLQTAEIVRTNLKIPKQNIYVNFNLREDDLALGRINSKKYEVGNPIWDTVEPYDEGLIRNVAEGGIETYVKQTLDEIFDKYKHLGNVLIITHGDIYNKYVPELFEGVGTSKLEEAGWAIFAPPSKDILANAGVGFFEML